GPRSAGTAAQDGRGWARRLLTGTTRTSVLARRGVSHKAPVQNHACSEPPRCTSTHAGLRTSTQVTLESVSPPTSHSGSSGQGLEELLEELRRRKWVLHLFGGREAPEMYAAVKRWPTCADVIILRDEHRASAYRV